MINNPLKRAEYDKIISPTRKGRAEKERSGAENRTPPNITAIEVVKVWKQIGAAMMGENVHLAALMNSVKTVDVQGITLVLGFASEIVKSKMKPAEMERTRKALFDIFGVMFDIRCIVVPRQTRSSAK